MPRLVFDDAPGAMGHVVGQVCLLLGGAGDDLPLQLGMEGLMTKAAEDYPSETFRVLKKNELRDFGEYRTQRLLLDAWDKLERGVLS